MIDKPKAEETQDKKTDEDEVLEPDEVVFDAAETAFLQAGDDSKDGEE